MVVVDYHKWALYLQLYCIINTVKYRASAFVFSMLQKDVC